MSASRTAVAAFIATHPVFRVEEFVAAHSQAGHRSPGTVTRPHAGGIVRVTSLERTLVDVLHEPDKGGSWEEILRSVATIEFVDADAVVLDALRRGRATTAARVGWGLTLRQDEWHVDAAHLEALRERHPGSPTYLDSSRTPGRLDGLWNLIIPETLPGLLAEVP